LGEANVFLALGDERTGQEDYPKALEFYQIAQNMYEQLDAKYNQSLNLLRMSDVYTRQKDLENAARSSLRAAEISPWWVTAWNSAGSALELLKRYAEAIEAYTRAIELEPNSAYLIRNRANVFMKFNRLEEAERDIALAVELQPDHTYTQGRQGELALVRGQIADALAHFQFAAEHGDDVGWQLELAIAHLASGNMAEAQKLLDSALPKANDENRENARGWLERVVKLHPDLAAEAEQIQARLKVTA
jgi:tetratricopeptide (TPR) repeat protein